MNPAILAEYRKFRGRGCIVGHDAQSALQSARVVTSYLKLKEAGLVTLRASPECENYFDVYGEPEGCTNVHGRRVSAEQERKEMCDILDRLGCWYVSSAVNRGCRHCGRSEWETVDGVGMCTGFDNPLSPYENPYVVDLMAAAIAAVGESENCG